jgi:hypothetical protein
MHKFFCIVLFYFVLFILKDVFEIVEEEKEEERVGNSKGYISSGNKRRPVDKEWC